MGGFNPDQYLAEKTASSAFDPDKYLAEKISPPEQPSTQGEAFIEGVGKGGAPFGLLPYLQAGVEKAITQGASMGRDTGSPMSALVQQYKDRATQLREQNPGTMMAGEIIGGIAPGAAISKGVAMAGAKFLPQAVQNLGMTTNFSKAGPVIPQLNAIGKIAKGATEGAVMGGLYTPDQGANLDQRLEQAKYGLAIGAAIPAAIEGGKAAISGAKNAAVKGFSAITGVNEDAIKQFYANPQKFLDAPTKEQVVERMQKIVNQVQDDVERGKVTVDEAKVQLKDMATNLKQTRGEASRIAREALREGNRQLDEAFKTTVNELKSKPAPTALQPQISESLKNLGDSVSSQSGAAFDVLKNEKIKLPAYDAYKWLGSTLENLKSGPPSDAANAAIAKLESYRNYLGPKAELTGEEAKTLLQAIDSDVKQWGKTFGRKNLLSDTLREFRAQIDAPLKNASPNYEAAMAPLAKDTELLVNSQKLFGSPDKALSKLTGVANPRSTENLKVLNDLGARTGKDFNSPIQDFIQTQRLLKSPEALNSIKQGLPQYAESQSLLAQAAKTKRMTDPREIQRLVNNSIENRSLNVAKETLAKSKDTQSSIAGWNNVYKRIDSAMNQMNDPAVQKQVEAISKLGGQDFADMINSLRVNKAFTGDRTNGARRALLGGLAGMTSGNPVLTFLGSAAGFMLDKYGPTVAKQSLVALNKVGNNPTVEKLMQAGITTQSHAQALVNALEKGMGAPAGSMGENALERRLKAR